MTRHHFDKELEELHHELIRMGSMVEESIENAIYALKKQDIELAKKVLDNDDAIDAQEKKIERICLMLIARQQPLAKDLRVISTALKIITDMERIADHSSDICEITLRMANERYVMPLIDIPLMAEKAKQMVNKAIDAYVKRDVELAKEVCASDDAVDELFSKITFEVTSIMRNNSEAVEQCVDFILIAKYLERMADHATNIGEWVIFSVTGEHMHLN
ncbi:phosphate transport system regulatory protein PhoU [Clostridium thermosuccinogenes]|uniref:Phosphate-specific transport system accessory protein PhoU n=1 Tax=Clostridium thermosuccinogenes TaxID=84032 RepID=A0A2K2FS79_9CLOT|nr:phosphate signaling complex protein PhoU [Pseudoclostridium thermosuccinogenes]AUS98861.1 phosphate transport system regulatory protein PhoU [Pseudoclostridium thermosuccinogenes]PNU00311.1 phosphate transport system regulatory protein PhoU [Pseudoclostridium thermosuccinogenes]PNU01636.1 phosphate transport system regulatory protein PhoU [Pseudoclostridium thermosuccinogenes]